MQRNCKDNFHKAHCFKVQGTKQHNSTLQKGIKKEVLNYCSIIKETLDYCPITLMSVVTKVLEKVIRENGCIFFNFLEISLLQKKKTTTGFAVTDQAFIILLDFFNDVYTNCDGTSWTSKKHSMWPFTVQ